VSSIRCPRCQAIIVATGDPSGGVICPGCGARLRTRPPAAGPAPTPAPGSPPAAAAPPARNPNKTLPPGTPLPKIPRPAAGGPPAPAGDGGAASAPESLGALLAEVRAVKALQEEILSILRERPSAPQDDRDATPFGMSDDVPTPARPIPAVRARRRKTVLLIDDDPASRDPALAALGKAEVPTRMAADGNAALAAIAEEKPDVIVLELGLGGSMGGKDVVNMIKATMEWVDIPIVLYTRLAVESQKEARQIHGADELVLKSAGPDALVVRVIAVFRKG
jgi:CheY-like chemotaxis protein